MYNIAVLIEDFFTGPSIYYLRYIRRYILRIQLILNVFSLSMSVHNVLIPLKYMSLQNKNRI